MDAKEYLNQAYWLDKLINSKLAMASSLREMATRTTSVMSDDVVSHTRNVHSMQDTISKLVDLENDIDADIDRLVDLKQEIIGIIGQITDPSCRIVLEYRYICYRSWKDIAVELGVHVRSVYRLHERALTEVSAILKNI